MIRRLVSVFLLLHICSVLFFKVHEHFLALPVPVLQRQQQQQQQQQQQDIQHDIIKQERTLQISDDDDNTDDRHGKNPNENNSTNSPAENISRIPSVSPSNVPSYSPTFFPSSHPSTIPSINPTILPTSTPTLYPSYHPSDAPIIQPTSTPTISYSPTIRHPCSKYNEYNFGYIDSSSPNDDNKLVLNYNYDVDTDLSIANQMGVSLIEETKVIEAKLLDLLIDIYFPECNISNDDNEVTRLLRRDLSTSKKYNIFESDMNSTTPSSTVVTTSSSISNNSTTNSSSNSANLIGMSSRPIDWTNGATCTPTLSESNNNNDDDDVLCNIMEGKLTLFYSHSIIEEYIRQNEENAILHSIKSIMDNGLLNYCHPAVTNVKFRNKTTNEFFSTNDDLIISFNDDTITITIIESQPSLWLVVGISTTLLGFIVITRYRYHHTHEKNMNKDHLSDTGSSSGSDDAFIEVGGLDNDEYYDFYDMAESASLSLSSPISNLTSQQSGSRSYQSYKIRSKIRSTSFSSKDLHSSSELGMVASDPPQQDPPSRGSVGIDNDSNDNTDLPPNEHEQFKRQLQIIVKGDEVASDEQQPNKRQKQIILGESSKKYTLEDVFCQELGQCEQPKSQELIKAFQAETYHLKAKLDAAKKLNEKLEDHHNNLKQYIELAKQSPTSSSIRRARLALLLINGSNDSANNLQEEY